MMNGPPQTVTIENLRSCERLFVNNIPDTRVSGVVTSSDGKPLEGVQVELADAEYWKLAPLTTISAYTDEAGLFVLQGVPPGRYIAGVNLLDVRSESVPYPRTLYMDGSKPFEVVIATAQALELGMLRLTPRSR
jgi:hypothetical protein